MRITKLSYIYACPTGTKTAITSYMRDSNTPKSFNSFSKRIVPMSLTLISCSLFISCGNFKSSAVSKAVAVSRMAKKSVASVVNLVPRRVPVAEVRPKDLKQMPSGADRALAWNRHLDSKRYASNFRWFAPKNYKAPKLPESRSMPTDGGILPPLHPGRGSSLEGQGTAPLD